MKKVIIEVTGGLAHIVSVPRSMAVEVRDFDCEEPMEICRQEGKLLRRIGRDKGHHYHYCVQKGA